MHDLLQAYLFQPIYWGPQSRTNHILTCRQATPPAWLTLLAPLKTVLVTRTQASDTALPSANLSALGMTVQPRRVPVKPAYLEKEHVSSAHVSAPESQPLQPLVQ